MENQTTVPPTPQTPAPAPEQSVNPPTSPSKPPVTVWLLVILLILCLGGLAFLAFQNFKLQGELAQMKQLPSPTAVVVPTSTPDPTANLETYTNTFANYQISYPSNWTVKALVADSPQAEVTSSTQMVELVDKDQTSSITIQKLELKPTSYLSSNEQLFGNLYSAMVSEKITEEDKSRQSFLVKNPNEDAYLEFQVNYPNNKESEVYEVLQTFKFTN